MENEKDELRSYQNIAVEYYYLGNMEKMTLYEERFLKGQLESDTSAIR